jgi:hypothetical protein
MIPIAEILLDHGADIFAVHEPWGRECVFDMIDSLKKRGHAELAATIGKYGEERRKVMEPAVKLGVEQFLARVRNADEKALSSLKEELPIEEGLDWIVRGRRLQEELGPSLEGLKGIEKSYVRGNWAEALLPAARQGDNANLHMVLMRYPGGAYHVVTANLTESNNVGRSIRHAELVWDQLRNAVYSAFDKRDKYEIGGSRSTGFPSRFNELSVINERGRLVVRGLDLPSWMHFQAELAKDLVYFWDDIWELSISRKMTFATEEKQLIMADGVMTLQNAEGKVVFSVSGDGVGMKTNDSDAELLCSEFIVDIDTLDVKCADSID